MIGTETSSLMGTFFGISLASFAGPFLGAVIARRLLSNTAGVVGGTLIGGSVLLARKFIVVAA